MHDPIIHHLEAQAFAPIECNAIDGSIVPCVNPQEPNLLLLDVRQLLICGAAIQIAQCAHACSLIAMKAPSCCIGVTAVPLPTPVSMLTSIREPQAKRSNASPARSRPVAPSTERQPRAPSRNRLWSTGLGPPASLPAPACRQGCRRRRPAGRRQGWHPAAKQPL